MLPQRLLPRTSVSYNVKIGAPPAFTACPSSIMSAALWPHQDDPIAQLDQSEIGVATPIVPENMVGASFFIFVCF